MTLVLEKFAPVCPAPMYEEMFARGITPRTILLLAHDIVANEVDYRQALAAYAPSTGRIILDNSVIELGGAVDLAMYKEAYSILNDILASADPAIPQTRTAKTNPSASHRIVVVLPDVLKDSQATFEASREAWLGGWREAFLGAPFMVIPQGKDLEDWLWCYCALIEKISCGWVGIPRNTTGRVVRSRLTLADLIGRMNKNIHLMGFSDYMHDDFIAARHWAVQSIDSAVPMRVASLNPNEVTEPRGEWWENAKWEEWIEGNLAYVNQKTQTVQQRY